VRLQTVTVPMRRYTGLADTARRPQCECSSGFMKGLSCVVLAITIRTSSGEMEGGWARSRSVVAPAPRYRYAENAAPASSSARHDRKQVGNLQVLRCLRRPEHNPGAQAQTRAWHFAPARIGLLALLFGSGQNYWGLRFASAVSSLFCKNTGE